MIPDGTRCTAAHGPESFSLRILQRVKHRERSREAVVVDAGLAEQQGCGGERAVCDRKGVGGELGDVGGEACGVAAEHDISFGGLTVHELIVI